MKGGFKARRTTGICAVGASVRAMWFRVFEWRPMISHGAMELRPDQYRHTNETPGCRWQAVVPFRLLESGAAWALEIPHICVIGVSVRRGVRNVNRRYDIVRIRIGGLHWSVRRTPCTRLTLSCRVDPGKWRYFAVRQTLHSRPTPGDSVSRTMLRSSRDAYKHRRSRSGHEMPESASSVRYNCEE